MPHATAAPDGWSTALAYYRDVRGPLELVIFDNDGVLVDSEPHAERVILALLSGLGWPLTAAESTERFLGRSIASIRGLAEAHLGRPLPPDFEDRYHAGLFEAFRELTPIPGIVEALDGISVPTCVASSGSHERIRLALKTTGLLDRFDGRIFSAQDVRRGKPAPDLFLHAAHTLGVDPARCAVIEDSPAGVEAANAAGMLALGYAGATPPARLAHAAAVFQSMTELPALLERPGLRPPATGDP